ncbi:MAG: WYL domain-containing protein [Lachnospiraceae bacterium]|nr:WYL domain-containing protein [Lachnospiraceae bacterium]
MPKGSNQKLKLYYLQKIMMELTDDDHGLSIAQIKTELEKYDVSADRKSLYTDLEALRVMGLDIIGEQVGKNYYYHVGEKQFEIAELKLLVDAIQSSKFITAKKSNQLIKKLEGCASKYEASQLHRQVEVTGRIKTMNESIYYNVDEIYGAINNNLQISFSYMKWNHDKKLELKKKEPYVVSPWALLWEDENYYLVAYDPKAMKIKHFRVDKMRGIQKIDKKREGKEAFGKFDIASYSKKNFSMYGGNEVKVKLQFSEELVGVIIDRFGKDINITAGKNGYTTTVSVAVSNQFFGWVFGLGSGIKIMGPPTVVSKYKAAISEVGQLY